jgi:hypothetical protein
VLTQHFPLLLSSVFPHFWRSTDDLWGTLPSPPSGLLALRGWRFAFPTPSACGSSAGRFIPHSGTPTHAPSSLPVPPCASYHPLQHIPTDPLIIPPADAVPSSGCVADTLFVALYTIFAKSTFEEGAVLAVNMGDERGHGRGYMWRAHGVLVCK